MNIFSTFISISIITTCIAKISIFEDRKNQSMAQSDLQKASFRVNLERHISNSPTALKYHAAK